MVWYGVVWCGVVWYGMVWYGMVWYGMVWYGVVLCGVAFFIINPPVPLSLMLPPGLEAFPSLFVVFPRHECPGIVRHE